VVRSAGTMRPVRSASHRGTMTPTPECFSSGRPSRRLAVLAGLLFTGGVSAGWLSYLHGSAAQVDHVPGTNAWWQQGGVAVIAGALGWLSWRRRRRGQTGLRWLLAPLSRAAAGRISLLWRDALRRPRNAVRATLACPLLLLFGYGFFRAGYQVTSGLNPADTVNAWGGPTYAGALACHYLDLFVILMVTAWLLDRLLPRPEPA
jgi:hypothetical protein